MDPGFWHQRWQNNEIGFHESRANPLMVRHFGRLGLPPGSRVFLPLCGKTLDIHWLLANGHSVAGAELSRVAIGQLFAELGVKAQITRSGRMERHSAQNLDIFVGDIFDLSGEALGEVDAVYDRAALVALPVSMRERYATHVQDITHHAPQLMITFEYDQSLADGPPFSIGKEEVQQRYGDSHAVELLESVDVAGGLKGKCPATEHVWMLKRRAGGK